MTLALPTEPEPDPVATGPDAKERTLASDSNPRPPKVPAHSGAFRAPGAGQVGAGSAR
jgi:hypothetical protein